MGVQQSTPASRNTSAACEPSLREKQSQAHADGVVSRLSSLRLDGGSASATLTADDVNSWRTAYENDALRQVVGTLLSKQDILSNLTNRASEIADTQVFNVKLSQEITPITNQKNSGRCWLFAATNCARLAFAKKYNVADFQFSQSYLFFWDHLEKANFYLENHLELVDASLDSRIITYLNDAPQNDGGQWSMVVNLLLKYGLVPQPLYPESYNSSYSGKMDSLITSKLREYALELRALYGKTLDSLAEQTTYTHAQRVNIALKVCRNRKSEQMKEIYTILAMCCGVPPKADEKFTYEFVDKNGKFQTIKATPLELYHSLAPVFKAEDSLSLINDPRNDAGKAYTVQRLGNVWDAGPVLYVNTTTQVMEDAVLKMLKADIPVWFGCDVGALENSALGIMDLELYNYKDAFGLATPAKLGMSKAERLQTGESSMTHAMVITAAHVDESGKPVRYRIENSWSDTAGSKGYFVCTSAWFREFVYQIVVPKKLAPPELVKVFETGKPVELPPWDPMGALA